LNFVSCLIKIISSFGLNLFLKGLMGLLGLPHKLYQLHFNMLFFGTQPMTTLYFRIRLSCATLSFAKESYELNPGLKHPLSKGL